MTYKPEEDIAPQSNCFYQLKDSTFGKTGFRCLTEAQYNEMVEAKKVNDAKDAEWANSHWYIYAIPFVLIILFIIWIDRQ